MHPTSWKILANRSRPNSQQLEGKKDESKDLTLVTLQRTSPNQMLNSTKNKLNIETAEIPIADVLQVLYSYN